MGNGLSSRFVDAPEKSPDTVSAASGPNRKVEHELGHHTQANCFRAGLFQDNFYFYSSRFSVDGPLFLWQRSPTR